MDKVHGITRKESILKIKLNASKIKYFENKQVIKDTLHEIKVKKF
jgi:hypothetical protein